MASVSQTALTDVASIEQLLDESTDIGDHLIVREPNLIRVSDIQAVARHYVLDYDLARTQLADLRYAVWRFEKGPEGRWSTVAKSEVKAGDSGGPDFLNDGLDRDFDALTVPGDQDGAVQHAADSTAIRATLAAYGLAADAGNAGLVGSLYTPDTVVDIAGDRIYRGRDSMAEMIRGGFHRSLLPWAGHTMGPSLISVRGDRAVSLHVGRTYGPPPRSVTDLSGWNRRPFRYSVNRWELVRADHRRWLVAQRRSCPAPGPDWRDLLAEGVREWRGAIDDFEPSPSCPDGMHELVDTRRALDVVTAAAFTLIVDADAHEWPFADDARIEIRRTAQPPTVGLLPTPGSVRVAGKSATVDNVVVHYVDDGSKRIGPARFDRCRWDLARDAGSWMVQGVTARPAGQ